MRALRVSLHVAGILATVYAALALWLLPWLDFGVAVAICSACVIGLGLVRAVDKDRERMRQERERVWRRRIEGTQRQELTVIRGVKDPDWLEHPGVYEAPLLGLGFLDPWPIDDEERQQRGL